MVTTRGTREELEALKQRLWDADDRIDEARAELRRVRESPSPGVAISALSSASDILVDVDDLRSDIDRTASSIAIDVANALDGVFPASISEEGLRLKGRGARELLAHFGAGGLQKDAADWLPDDEGLSHVYLDDPLRLVLVEYLEVSDLEAGTLANASNLGDFDVPLTRLLIGAPIMSWPGYEAFSELLKAMRAHKGISQRDLAEIINVSHAQVSHLENNRRERRPPIHLVDQWASACGYRMVMTFVQVEDPPLPSRPTPSEWSAQTARLIRLDGMLTRLMLGWRSLSDHAERVLQAVLLDPSP